MNRERAMHVSTKFVFFFLNRMNRIEDINKSKHTYFFARKEFPY